jgi:hypothetical protein
VHCVQGKQATDMVSDTMLEQLLDRSHLAARSACPYADSGPGYEVVHQHTSGLLSSVQ